MKKNKNANVNANEYYDRMHRIGNRVMISALLLFFAIPLIISVYYDIMPKFSDLLIAAGGLSAIFIPIGIAETFAEIPVMGSSYYISLVTGNVLNLKLPAALNALKVADLKQGTEKGDAVIGVAVAVSSLVTLAMLAIGMLLLTPLQPLLSSPVVSTAAGYVLPALFGCLFLGSLSDDVGGGVLVHKRLLALAIPFVVCVAIYILIPDLYETFEGFVIILCIPAIYFFTKKLYKKGVITVELPEDKDAAPAQEELQ
ncbi:MAG: hypothetical protein PUK54_07185 [Firmicutes bacterium]|nr:hypothetical protein [Bacillota bacterium]MDY5855655.1 hypothetical protein [Anaerovoracaceae bacterium]